MKKTFLLIIFTGFIFIFRSQEKVHTVYFGFDIYKLSTKNIEGIKLKYSSFSDKKIKLKGYTDYIGTNQYNYTLSQKRVASVKKQLLQNGFNMDLIEEEIGLGELVENSDRSLNRKVDIIIENIPLPEIEEEEEEEEAEEIVVVEKTIIENSFDEISKLNVGESLVLDNMEFIPGRHFLMEYSKPELNKLLSSLIKYSTLKVEIQGHICCDMTGGDGLDFDTKTENLSENRAKHIYDFLIQNGISKKRLKYKGFGSSKPLVKEITEEDQQRNRRVEIEIIEK